MPTLAWRSRWTNCSHAVTRRIKSKACRSVGTRRGSSARFLARGTGWKTCPTGGRAKFGGRNTCSGNMRTFGFRPRFSPKTGTEARTFCFLLLGRHRVVRDRSGHAPFLAFGRFGPTFGVRLIAGLTPLYTRADQRIYACAKRIYARATSATGPSSPHNISRNSLQANRFPLRRRDQFAQGPRCAELASRAAREEIDRTRCAAGCYVSGSPSLFVGQCSRRTISTCHRNRRNSKSQDGLSAGQNSPFYGRGRTSGTPS